MGTLIHPPGISVEPSLPQPSRLQNTNLSSLPAQLEASHQPNQPLGTATHPLGITIQPSVPQPSVPQNSNLSSLPVQSEVSCQEKQPLGTSIQLDGNSIQPETTDSQRQVSSLVPLPVQTNGPNIQFSTHFPSSPPPGFQFRNFPPPFHPAGINPHQASGTSSQSLQSSAPPFHPRGISTDSSGITANPPLANDQAINTHQPTTTKNAPSKVKNSKMSDDDVKNHPLYKNQISQLEICRGTNVSLSNKISRLEETI